MHVINVRTQSFSYIAQVTGIAPVKSNAKTRVKGLMRPPNLGRKYQSQYQPPFHHPVLRLVALHEGVLGLPSEDVHLCTHGVGVAGETRVFPLPAWFAIRGWLVLYQPFLNQTFSRRLKDVQGETLDAALKKSTLLFTVFGKTRLLLEKQKLKP